MIELDKKERLNHRAKDLIKKAKKMGMVYEGNKAFDMYPPTTDGYFAKEENNKTEGKKE